MSNTENQINEREAIEAMLPWYERGQLDAGDAKRVEAYLSAHPDMASQLALVEEERMEAVQLNEARGVPSSGALDSLMNSIVEHEAANPSLASTKTAIWGWASKLMGAPVPASLQWVAAAAAVLIVVQGVSLGVLMTSGVPQGLNYETASGPGQVATQGSFALVQFAEGARAEDINKILTEMGFTIVDGPKPGGVYKIRISDEVLEVTKRDTILKELLAQQNLFSFAEPAE
jgi:anti-sigma factor RsiW